MRREKLGVAMMIRDAMPADETAWRKLWAGFLAYYEVELAEAVTDHTWKRLMLPTCPMQARLAVWDGEVVGFAIHQHHPSTWILGEDCYLEDLYVQPESRGIGAGRALIEDLIGLARARGWQRLYWNTDQDNAAARRLYDSFANNDGHLRYRMAL